MRIRNCFAALLLLLALGACDSAGERFTVRGNISDPLAEEPGSMVYLSGRNGPVDSARVRNGAFSFSGSIDKTKLYTVTLHFPGRSEWDERFTASFVPDAETISIDLDYPVTVTGSPLTEAINRYQEQVVNLYYEPGTDVGNFELNGEQEVADSIRNEQMLKIVELSKATYMANTDNALGLQALSLLISELDREELEALVELGDAFIREDQQIKRLIESK